MTQLLFLREFLVDPKTVGSVWPSNDSLARKMAARIRNRAGEWLVELGPGTGTITEALLKKAPASRMVLIEKSDRMAQLLRRRFPTVSVLNEDALQLKDAVERNVGRRVRVGTIVSSLPLRNFDPETRERMLEQIRELLVPGGVYIQYTYMIGTSQKLTGMKLKEKETIWLNVPPATISVHQKN